MRGGKGGLHSPPKAQTHITRKSANMRTCGLGTCRCPRLTWNSATHSFGSDEEG